MKILSNILVKAGVIVDNYVAIGTNSPFAGYNIDSRGSHNFGNTSTEVYHYFQSSSVSGGSTLSVYVNNTSANSSRSHIMLADTAASVPTRFGLGVFTGETPYAYLDSASKLVINNASGSNVIVGGTTDNGYKFQVNGDITAGVYRGANGAPLATFDAATSRVKIDAQGYGSTTGHSLIVSDYLSVEARAVFNANLKAKGANNTITYGITRPDAPALDSVSIAGIGPLFSDPWYTGLGLSFYVSQSADISTGGGLAEKFRISANGDITAFNLAGSGNRMVIVNSSGVLSTQAIPSISNYVTTDTTQTISGQKTFSALTTIFDSTQTATFIEGRASGVLYGGMSFSLYMQFNAYAAATGGYLWKNGAGDNVMALSQAGALTVTNLAGSGDRMVVADSNGVLTTQAIPSGGTSASTRTIQKFTSTASQTTFTITGGYTVGMVDVFLNGVKIDNATDFTATNGTTVVLTEALAAGQTVEVYKYGSQFIVNNGLRQTTLFSATAGQTTFTVSYSVGLVDVFYNGSKLDSSEYTATNGTSIVLGTACAANDKVEVIAYSYNVGAFTGVGGSGTINYIPKFTASGTIGNSILFDDGTNVGIGTATVANYFSRTITIDGASSQGIMFRASGTDRGFLYQDGSFIQLGSNTGGVIFKSNDTERMRITTTGEVGIGVTPSSGNKFWIKGIDSTSNNTSLLVQNSSNAWLLFVRNDGNVGIGTSNPSRLLTVVSASDGITAGISGSTYGIRFDNGGTFSSGMSTIHGVDASLTGSYQPIMINGSDVRFGTSATERMRISSGGNVGINSSNPTGRLHIGSDNTPSLSGTSPTGAFVIQSTATTAMTMGVNPNGPFNGWIQMRHGALADIAYGLMLQPLGGTVVIGTSSGNNSGATLQVEGTGSFGPLSLRFANAASGRLWKVGPDGANNFVIYNENNTGAYINYSATSWTGNSDIRLKNIINPITDAISKLAVLNPIIFSWKSDDTNKENLGLIAQDVEKVFPQIIDINSQGMLGVRYTELIPVLVKAIQEQQEQRDQDKAEIELLKSQIAQFGSN